MKYAKKSILVPETEYHALLSMLKTGNYLENEKTTLDSKIVETLDNKKLNENIKGKKYDWLYKKRRQLKNEIENKPTRVIIDESQLKNIISPYLGINQVLPQSILKNAQLPLTSTPQVSPIRRQRRSILQSPNITDNTSFANALANLTRNNGNETRSSASGNSTRNTTNLTRSAVSGTEDEDETVLEQPQIATRSKAARNLNLSDGPVIKNKFHEQLKVLLQTNLRSFNIGTDGRIIGMGNRRLKDTNYIQIVDYLTGKREEKPKGFEFVMLKLQQNNEYRDLVEKSKQIGAGKKRKRIVVMIKDIKRNKIQKTNLFKPKIWEKL